MLNSNRRLLVSLYDLLTIPLAWFGAYFFRFNLEPLSTSILEQVLYTLPLLFIVQGLVYRWQGLYLGVWRFASIPDFMRIVKAVVIGVSISVALVFIFNRMEGMPRSIFPLYGMLLFLLLGGARISYRIFKDRRILDKDARPVLIVGAGRGGEIVARELNQPQSQNSGYLPVGFVDDARGKQGREVQGLQVLGRICDVATVVAKHEIKLIIIAMPSVSSAKMREIVSLCEKLDIDFRTLPRVSDMALGKISVNTLREVSIDDLLGRDQVKLDWESIKSGINDKTIMITGGGGSIGSELCRQIAIMNPAALIIFERSEFNLYEIEKELSQKFPEMLLYACLGDVSDRISVDHVMSKFRPNVVFHAAAYKHVPMLQHQVREAVKNNVLGTKVLAESSNKHGVDCFVMISTDKAVNPTNVMGASKRVAEIFCQNFNSRATTSFITVRFGNVLGSAGSVVPLFKAQLKKGGPLTVTHPDMLRYFMTIPEACQLIMQSAVMGKGGEIFVLDMGEPVNITYLAEQMIRLSGKEPGKDVEIVYTGLRPGEKLFEELFHESESLSSTRHEKVMLANYREVDWKFMSKNLDEVESKCATYDEDGIYELVKTFVPEMKPTVVKEERLVSNSGN
ncbi:UDP-N-acetylglucosamine 4,6-dehydratase [hydrothermal vent metagenome]|uniref:UDP-N-acetylglucosamine 4,6-dehydratase n=1 Tax=hydrothermal vent metagenome TaxID=652676 RepID=A0A3B1C1L9_9ZZZZ